MTKNMTLPIDYDKLITELRKRGMGPTEASREMGFSDAYLSKARNKPELRNPTIVALEKTFGISYDAIKPEELSKPAPVILEQVQDGVVDTLTAINQTLQQLNATMTAIREQTARALDLVEPLKEPMALYKTIFMPIYAAVRAGEVDGATDEEKKRRIDGTISMSGFGRRP